MKVCKLIPHGWVCSIGECPPGLFTFRAGSSFTLYGDDHNCIGFKSEYTISIHEDHSDAKPQVFNEAGEYLRTANGLLEVQPLEVSWEEA